MKSVTEEKINCLRQEARSVVRELGLLNDAYFDIGVTLAERHLLIELNALLYPTVGEIAQRLLLDKSTASRLIAKAVKKGYVHYVTDAQDKRKRFLQLTDEGKKVLNAFEPIAFNQTKEALLTLSQDETEMVYKGVSLYAKGLKNARLRSQLTVSPASVQDQVAIAQLLGRAPINHQAIYFALRIESKFIGGAKVVACADQPGCYRVDEIYLEPEWGVLGFEPMIIDKCIAAAKELWVIKWRV